MSTEQLAPGPQDTRLRWRGRESGFDPATTEGELVVADSFLLSEGAARALDRHAARFARACAEVARLPHAEALAFVQDALERLPRRGDWFPRLELRLTGGTHALELLIRPAPPRGHSVALWLADAPDVRTRPAIKGADLEYLGALRRRAQEAGGQEAVLCSPAGSLLEGASTSILWWRADALCCPPAGPDLLAGVTRETLIGGVREAGGEVRFERVRPEALDGLEIWAVNALHGIRSVERFIGAALVPGPPRRAPHWRRYLEELMTAETPDATEQILGSSLK